MSGLISYVKKAFKNYPDTTTPVNAANLNHLDNAIYDLDQAVGNALGSTDISAIGNGTVKGAISNINSQLTDNGESFKFGYDSVNDEMGYYKKVAGADTFFPFMTKKVKTLYNHGTFTDLFPQASTKKRATSTSTTGSNTLTFNEDNIYFSYNHNWQSGSGTVYMYNELALPNLPQDKLNFLIITYKSSAQINVGVGTTPTNANSVGINGATSDTNEKQIGFLLPNDGQTYYFRMSVSSGEGNKWCRLYKAELVSV